MKISDYLERWYVKGSRTAQSVKNDLENGRLPGEKEANGTWFIWVSADDRPDWSYHSPNKTTGNSLADQILNKHNVA